MCTVFIGLEASLSQGSEITSFPSDSRFCGGIIVFQVGQRKRTYFFFHKVVRMSRVGPRPCSPWFRQLLSDKAFSVKCWSLR